MRQWFVGIGREAWVSSRGLDDSTSLLLVLELAVGVSVSACAGRNRRFVPRLALGVCCAGPRVGVVGVANLPLVVAFLRIRGVLPLRALHTFGLLLWQAFMWNRSPGLFVVVAVGLPGFEVWH